MKTFFFLDLYCSIYIFYVIILPCEIKQPVDSFPSIFGQVMEVAENMNNN